MNLNPLDHSELTEFEAELLGKRPRLNAKAQQSIIYQAAFQAGKASTYKSTRIWQTCTAGLSLILALNFYPWRQVGFEQQITKKIDPLDPIPSLVTTSIPNDSLLGIYGDQGRLSFNLESWKTLENISERFDEEMKKLALLDLHEKAHSLIQLTRLENLGN